MLYDNEMLIVDEQLTRGAKEMAFVCCEVEGLGLMCGNKQFLDIPIWAISGLDCLSEWCS
jgi:hypothetical protein